MKVGVIFGGKSCEHDISIITAIQAMGHLSALHECVPVYIDNDGVWWVGKQFDKHETFQKPVRGKRVHLRPQSNALYSEHGRKLYTLDAVIICNHGMNGEDGTLAGVLELAGIPYAGSGVRASAVGMDKITLKHLLRGLDIPVTKYIALDKYTYFLHYYDAENTDTTPPSDCGKTNPETVAQGLGDGNCDKTLPEGCKNPAFLHQSSRPHDTSGENKDLGLPSSSADDAENTDTTPPSPCATCAKRQTSASPCTAIAAALGFPIIVKPSNLGSSIGIGIAHNEEELAAALDVAFKWDTRVIAEEALVDFIEVNCAVLGYGGDYTVSEVEQPTGWKEFLSFKDKYEGGFKGTASRNMPAQISPELRRRVRELARSTFDAIGAAGVARIDFLIKDDEVFVNEINTVPGSLSNYLFAFDGMSFTELLDKLLELALRAHEDKAQLTYTYNSPRLSEGIKK